jgi:signal transduction histidine kinase
MAGFTVDTKLFRELGELLVGRDTTALVELIKNAYDADATSVAISGRNLSDSKKGEIVITDDGIGMNKTEFEVGFLRIAGRTKTAEDRRSPWFKRRYTGEKGVGRLAAHKLARALRVTSRRWNDKGRDDLEGFPAVSGVQASIDWDAVEAKETLEEVARSNAVTVDALKSKEVARKSAGTRLTLRRLRQPWTDRSFSQFFAEVVTLTPPDVLSGTLPNGLLAGEPLLSGVRVRDSGNPGSFSLQFLDELLLRQPDLPAEAQSSSWVIEINCDARRRTIGLLVSPTTPTTRKFPTAEVFRAELPFIKGSPKVSFQARILQRDGKAWPNAYAGVRVYHEGFRVLPYGDPKDDWLDLDTDYRSRAKGELGRLAKYSAYSGWDMPPGEEKEGLVVQGNRQFFGGVFLTREGTPDLRLLVNREGFLPGHEWNFVTDVVRLGIDLQVRQRYAATSIVKEARRVEKDRQRSAAKQATVYEAPTAFLVGQLHSDALGSLREARDAVSRGDTSRAVAQLAAVEKQVSDAAELVGENASEATIYRVLASMGLEQAAFIHEVNAIAVLTQGVAKSLEELAKSTSDPALKRRLRAVAAEAITIRERLRRNATYLADMTGIEGRRRRSRQLLSERFESVRSYFADAVDKRKIKIDNKFPSDLATPPMFPAEVSAILANLLSNAIKFADEGGRVTVSGQRDADELVVRMENTGARVNLKRASRWFEPFQSSTVAVDERLGQGMGLGLTITRSLIEEYGGTIEFTTPSGSFATAIELRLPTK